MTNEELNRRLAFFAHHGLPYSDTVWRLLAEAYEQGFDDHRAGRQLRNPYQDLLSRAPAPARLEPQGAPLRAGQCFPNDLTLRDPNFKARAEAFSQGAPRPGATTIMFDGSEVMGTPVKGAPTPYECTRASPCGNCPVCWD